MEDSGLSSLLSALSGLFIVLAFVLLVVGVILFVAECFVFEKAGYNFWKNFIPYYRTYIFFKISGLSQGICLTALSLDVLQTCLSVSSGIGFIVSIVSIAIFAFKIPLCIGMSKRFGHSGLFAVGLFLLPFIFYPILAFGKSEYTTPLENSEVVTK